MKKTLYLLIAILLVFTSVIALSSCNKNENKTATKSIDLTVDNIYDYIIINVIEDEIQFEYVGSYKHYFKNINVTTKSKINAQYENLKITFNLEPSVSSWVPQSGKSIEVAYTGESETQFYVSADLTKTGYVSPTPKYKVIVTQVEGKIIIE